MRAVSLLHVEITQGIRHLVRTGEISSGRADEAVGNLNDLDLHLGHWDADRLAEVVSNLVGNAIEHGAEAPVTLVVSEAGEPREAHCS